MQLLLQKKASYGQQIRKELVLFKRKTDTKYRSWKRGRTAKGQNSKGIIIPIPLAEDRKKPPLQNMRGITIKMYGGRHINGVKNKTSNTQQSKSHNPKLFSKLFMTHSYCFPHSWEVQFSLHSKPWVWTLPSLQQYWGGIATGALMTAKPLWHTSFWVHMY